jgi:hypothetical protein
VQPHGVHAHSRKPAGQMGPRWPSSVVAGLLFLTVVESAASSCGQNWTASALSRPTGHNTPHTCPGCTGQAVHCRDCGNIAPMFGGIDGFGDTPELSSDWQAAIPGMVSWFKGLQPGARILYGPSFSAGEGSEGHPLWAGIVNPHTGVTGPAGHDILGNATCGNFSGPWWDGQVADLKQRWTAFLAAFKAAGGTLDEVALDTEVSMVVETITDLVPFSMRDGQKVRLESCGPQRWLAIGRDPRWPRLRAELEKAGMVIPAHGPGALWEAVRNCVKKRTGPGSGNCQAWDAVMYTWAAQAFNTSLVQPALAPTAFPALRIGDYSFAACRPGSGIPGTSGTCGCGGCGGMPGMINNNLTTKNRTGDLVGNLQVPVCYQIFSLFSSTYTNGAPRIGLPQALAKEYDVPSFTRTTFNVMKYDVFLGREKAAAGHSFKPWVGISRMGVAFQKLDPYPAYGVTNGSGYYVETMFHLALEGSRGFYFWNPIQWQVNGEDNALFSKILRELDVVVPYCEAWRWVADFTADSRQPWVDGYVLTGAELAGRGRVWRLTLSMKEHTVPPPDPQRFVVSTSPLTVRIHNADDLHEPGDGGTVTTLVFGGDAVVVHAPVPLLSHMGMWIAESEPNAPLPNRTLCDSRGESCRRLPWPR